MSEESRPEETPVTTTASNGSMDIRQKVLMYGLAFLAVLFLIFWLGQSYALKQYKIESAAELKAKQEEFDKNILEAQDKANLKQIELASHSMATGLVPVMTLYGQVPEVTDRTLQNIVERLVQQGDYSYVMIAGPESTILASSDLTEIGRQWPSSSGSTKVEGAWQSASSISTETAMLGTVVLRLRSN